MELYILVKLNFIKKNNSFIDNETICYVMPKERSIDIDDNNQWTLAEKIHQKYE